MKTIEVTNQAGVVVESNTTTVKRKRQTAKNPTLNLCAARYVDIQKHWRRLKPFFHSEAASRIWRPCLMEFSIFRADDNGYNLSKDQLDRYSTVDFPEGFDSCDWRWGDGRKGPCPEFWAFACHSACHWIVDLGMFVAMSAWPDTPWRIVTSQKHSTIWNGDYQEPLLFDINFSALKVKPEEALRLAWVGRKMKPHGFLKNYLHNHTLSHSHNPRPD